MEKIFKYLYIIIIFAILSLPLIFRPFVHSDEGIGNEQIYDMPKYIDDNGINESFSSEFDSWYSQGNPFRTLLINASNTINLGIFKSSSNGVISGESEYLFSEEELDDYLGNTLSERSIYRIAKTVALVEEYARSKGSNFTFTVVPNKSSVYDKYMPSRYIKSRNNNYDNLSNELSRLNVNFTDMKSVITSHEEELYLRDDTHWNNLGALYGYYSLMSSLGKEHKDYSGKYVIKEDWTGDLTKMAFPNSNRLCSQYYFEDDKFSEFSFMQPRARDTKEMLSELMGDSEKQDGLIRTSNPTAKGSLYILRDSFGRALLPYLVDSYNKTYITRYQPLDIVNNEYDDIIWEVVERNLKDTVKSSPVISSPLREDISSGYVDNSNNNKAYIEYKGNFANVYGTVNPDIIESDSNIFIILSNNNTKYTFEAFPVYEQEKLKDTTDKDNGFSSIVDLSILAKGVYDISAVVSDHNGYVTTQTLNTIEKG